MLNNQAVRTILVATVFITSALFVMRFFEGPDSLATDDEMSPPPAFRVAQDTRPTIVRPKEDWLDHPQDNAANMAAERLVTDEDDTAYLGPPVSLDGADGRTLRR